MNPDRQREKRVLLGIDGVNPQSRGRGGAGASRYRHRRAAVAKPSRSGPQSVVWCWSEASVGSDVLRLGFAPAALRKRTSFDEGNEDK